MDAPVYLCRNKTCRRAKGFEELERRLGDRAQPVPCQKVCKGPVVGFEVHGRIEWFRKLRSPKLHKLVMKALAGAPVAEKLWLRRVKKRKGKLRFKGVVRKRR